MRTTRCNEKRTSCCEKYLRHSHPRNPWDTIPRRPEVQAAHPTLVEQLPVDPHRTLALQEADRGGHAVLGPDAQAQVDVVEHRMPFHQVDPSLTAQLPQDHADRPPQPP